MEGERESEEERERAYQNSRAIRGVV
jgi:hypothetical protein